MRKGKFIKMLEEELVLARRALRAARQRRERALAMSGRPDISPEVDDLPQVSFGPTFHLAEAEYRRCEGRVAALTELYCRAVPPTVDGLGQKIPTPPPREEGSGPGVYGDVGLSPIGCRNKEDL